MRIAFHASVGKKFDGAISAAFADGVRTAGHKCRVIPTADWKGEPEPDAAVGVVVGVKDKSAPIFQAYRAAGKQAVFIDKGYARIRGGPLGTLYWRVSVNAFQPLEYFQKVRHSSARWDSLGVTIDGKRRSGQNILFAGSSQKFCTWQGLGDATKYAEKVLAGIGKYARRPIIYRPKPSWTDAVPVDSFGYSPPTEKFQVELANAHVLVTYGSNACFEALINGVPTIVLGDGVTRPLSDTSLEAVERPRYPSAKEVHQLAYDLAYCQWTLEEMTSGETWQDIASHLEPV